jgi:hypothetical protein
VSPQHVLWRRPPAAQQPEVNWDSMPTEDSPRAADWEGVPKEANSATGSKKHGNVACHNLLAPGGWAIELNSLGLTLGD